MGKADSVEKTADGVNRALEPTVGSTTDFAQKMISLLYFEHLFIFNALKYRWILQQEDRYYLEHETEQ